MSDTKSTKINQQQGAALVISLLILSLAMISATALARVILTEIRISFSTINSMTAFYAAESAIEKAFYYLKYSQENDDASYLSTLDDFSYSLLGSDATFRYTTVSTSTAGLSFYNITTTTPAHADIIDIVGNLPNTIDWDPTTNLGHYYRVAWSINDCFPNHASDRLEITRYFFDTSNPFDVGVSSDLVVCDCSFGSDACNADLTRQDISDNNFYRFSFRPLDDNVKSLIFNVYTSAGQLTTTTSNFYVVADGQYKNIRYRVTGEVLPTSPVADIFSFVVFSEEIIKKK